MSDGKNFLQTRRKMSSVFFWAAFLLWAHGAVAQDTFTSTGGHFDWTTAATWTCGGCGRNYPGQGGVTTDIVIIEHGVAFASFSAITSATVASLTIRNVSATATILYIYGDGANANGRSLTVNSDIVIQGTSSNNAILGIYDNAVVNAVNLSLTRSATHVADYTAQLDMFNSSTLNLSGNLTYTNNCTQPPVTTPEPFSEIDLGRNGTTFPKIRVGGDFSIVNNTTQQGNISVILRSTSQMKIGYDATDTPTANGNMTLTASNAGAEPSNNINILLSNSLSFTAVTDSDASSADPADATLTIRKNLTLNLADDPDGPDIAIFARGASDLIVNGDITCNHACNTSASEIRFKLADAATLTCRNLNYNSTYFTSGNNNILNAYEDSYVTVDGDITMAGADGAPTANYIGMDGNSTLKLKGNVLRTNDSGSNSDGSIEFLSGSSSHAIFAGAVGSQTIFATYTNGMSAADENIGAIVSGKVYRNIEINNTSSSPLALAAKTMIRGSLTLSSGVVNTTASNYFIFPNGVATPPGNTGSYIDGPIRKFGTSSITLGAGNAGVWAPIEISAINDGGAGSPSTFPDLTIEYRNDPASGSVSPPLAGVSGAEYWSITAANNSFGVNVTANVALHWKDACTSDIQDVSTSPQDLYMAQRTTGNWSQVTPTTISGSKCDTTLPGNEAGYITSNVYLNTSAAASTDSRLTFGTLTWTNPLPIVLMNFEAFERKGGVELAWSTASESMADKFEIEKSENGIEFKKIGEEKATGESRSAIQYVFTDREAPGGKLYYRLKLLDRDGSFEYSEVISITHHTGDNDLFELLPNSSEVDIFYKSGSVTITVFNSNGKSIFSGVEEGGVKFDLTPLHLAPGIYIIAVATGNAYQAKKVLVQNWNINH